jgi:hypothetical protein
MSKMNQSSEQDYNVDDVYDQEITDDDYGFIFDAEGNLKSVFLPDNVPFKTPKNIAKILKIFGITDLDNIDNTQTLH